MTIRPVWYVGENAESVPLELIEEGTRLNGRPPDAFGIYRDNSDGTQTHIEDCPSLEDARRKALCD